jgi:hypothetical protein
LCLKVSEDLIICNELFMVILANLAQELDTFWVLFHLFQMIVHQLNNLNTVTLPVVLIFKERATNEVGWIQDRSNDSLVGRWRRR